MIYKQYSLPEYPVTDDMWEELKRETRPIVVYGMGNGADKLFSRLEKYGITPSDVFASDGFVRGHSFRGMRVKSFSEIKNTYEDFVILLSFASNRQDVLDMLRNIDEEYDMYVPDMPIADEAEYFDMTFYNENYDEILQAYNSLDDDISKNAFSAIIRYKLSGRMSYLMNCYSTTEEIYSALPCNHIAKYIDVGAYNGDTLREAVKFFPSLSEAVAIEPDSKNYKRLLKYKDTVVKPVVKCINAAASDRIGDGIIASAGNRNSTISATASYEHKDMAVSLITIDSLDFSCDFIKYDVEGAEYEALVGSHETIMRNSPTLLVSLYHRSRDIFFLINYLKGKYPEYTMKLRRLMCLPAWEIDLILTRTR